jgi:predicted RNA binding protein YcfA (HicA-like mRNA interferase family)
MPDFPHAVRKQLAGKLTAGKFQKALERDGWVRVRRSGASLLYIKDEHEPITVHFHPKKVYSDWGLLGSLIDVTGWTVEDLRRLKLISKR